MGTLLHNVLPDILTFTDSQIDKLKGYRAVKGTKEVISGMKTRVEPKAFTDRQRQTSINSYNVWTN
jgi:hypothetical protein